MARSKLKYEINEKAVKVVMGLNNGLHNVPVRIDAGQSSMAPPPFNSNNKANFEIIKLLLCSDSGGLVNL